MLTVRKAIELLNEFDPDIDILIDCGDGECPVGEAIDQGHGLVIYAEGIPAREVKE